MIYFSMIVSTYFTIVANIVLNQSIYFLLIFEFAYLVFYISFCWQFNTIIINYLLFVFMVNSFTFFSIFYFAEAN